MFEEDERGLDRTSLDTEVLHKQSPGDVSSQKSIKIRL